MKDAEVRIYVDADLGGLAGVPGEGTWEQLELFMIQWRGIERLVDLPGPFIYRANRTVLRAVPLD